MKQKNKYHLLCDNEEKSYVKAAEDCFYCSHLDIGSKIPNLFLNVFHNQVITRTCDLLLTKWQGLQHQCLLVDSYLNKKTCLKFQFYLISYMFLLCKTFVILVEINLVLKYLWFFFSTKKRSCYIYIYD